MTEVASDSLELPAGPSKDQSFGWNWVWFVPLLLWVLKASVWRNLTSTYWLIKLAHHRWTWAVFLSPSAAVCAAAFGAWIILPLNLAFSIPVLFSDKRPAKHPYWTSIGIVALIWISCLVLEAIIWGSFPLEVDKHGFGHLRLIPFFPWPQRPYGEF